MPELNFERPVANRLEQVLIESHDFMQVLQGPRQVGKTTVAEQIAARWKGPVSLVAADSAVPLGPEWVASRWDPLANQSQVKRPGLLIVDEIQKVPRWSEEVKRLWDEEKRKKRGLRVLLLGSSSLLVQKGLSESLAGRFQLNDCQHWPFSECSAAFGMSLDEWIFFGGYPGAAKLRKRQTEWASYINGSLIETVIARDVLQLQTVNKPALLRHLFGLSAGYPAQILSYNKMLGQLTDAGNTTTLSHYLTLLESAFLVSGLPSFREGQIAQRASSPKLVLWNNALVNALSGRSMSQAREDSTWWGRLVENAVGAHLLTHLSRSTHQLFYWRDGDDEIDFVVKTPTALWALEVKSGRPASARGMGPFLKRYPRAKPMLIGEGGIKLKDFFSKNPQEFL